MAIKSAETRTQLLRKAEQKKQGRIQGQDRPFFAFVQEYNAAADTTLVDSHGGRRVIRNPQPHLGQSSWLRAGPEGGMGALLITRSDSEEPEIMRWWHTDTQQRLSLYRLSVANLSSGTGQLASDEAFRPIESGEIDLQSRGGCALFMGSRPFLDMRAGIIAQSMDQDEAHYATKAPLHIRRGFQNLENEISDEERFGVVKRALNGSYIDSFFPDTTGNRATGKGSFTKEHLIRLSNSSANTPSILFDKRAGHVMDDQGTPVSLPETGINLRAKTEFFTPQETVFTAQLDENGNFKIEHPADATYGGLFVLPSGSMRARIGVDFDRTVNRNELAKISVDKVQNIGNDDSKTVGNNRSLMVIADENKTIGGNSSESISGNKTIKVNGSLIIQTGANSSRMGFTGNTSAFEAEVLSILATKEIIFEAPIITFNTPSANFTGQIKAEGVASNGGIVAPNLGRKDFSGTKGRAGTIPQKAALRTEGI